MSSMFQLKGVKHHGQVFSKIWKAPQPFCDTSFAEVLHTLDITSPDVLEQARTITLRPIGDSDAGVWWLCCGSSDLVCTWNGKPLLDDQQVRMGDGDEIEVGFTRFQVVLNTDQSLDSVSTPIKDSLFELSDLDGSRWVHLGAEQLQRSDSDISDLLVDTEPDLSQQADEPIQQAIGNAPSQDPLQNLHADYLRRLRSPFHTDPIDAWQDIERAERTSSQDAFVSLMKAAGPRPGLDDLLGQSHRIEDVMAGFNGLGDRNILAPEKFESVFYLFAPKEFVTAKPLLLVDATVALDFVLPAITQREHHSLSLDSAMPDQKVSL